MTTSTQNIKTGTVTGTGAALNIVLGFEPSWVRVYNITDGDECFDWFDGMTAGHAMRQVGGAAFTRLTTNGFTAYAGTAGGVGVGITLGTAISESTKLLGYIAVGK
jgi:hypothetical protein